MKYKVGDKVKVREDLVAGESYNGIYFSKGCNEFRGKESVIEDIYSDCYYLELTDEYSFTDDMLELVEECLLVRCIDNCNNDLTLAVGTLYEIQRKCNTEYQVINDDGILSWYYKSRFELVKEDKQVKKYTLMELLDFPIGTKFNRRNLNPNVLVEVEVELIDNVKRIICNATDDNDKGIVFSEIWAKAKYTKIEPTVSFIEAWKAYQEGKRIESVLSESQYSKNYQYDTISIEELEGKWQILK